MRHSFSTFTAWIIGFVSLPGELVRIETIKIAAHKHGNKEIPSEFFDLPGAENVSAVIFSNEGTIPKFNRMGFDVGRHTGSG